MTTWTLLAAFFTVWSKGLGHPRFGPFAQRTLFSEPMKVIPGPEKNYTGFRQTDDSLLLVYYHEQTVAVVEVANDRRLFTCELLEVRTKADRQSTLRNIKDVIPTQISIGFIDMLDLMSQCQKLECPSNLNRQFVSRDEYQGKQLNAKQISNVFSGVFPGTKWCGNGDLARSYYDLGPDKQVDKCCRTHDLCPVKVLGFKTQYNITNYSLYTRSHCECDDMFYNCLKSVGTTSSNILGTLYFNLAQVTCVEDIEPHLVTTATKKFKTLSKRY